MDGQRSAASQPRKNSSDDSFDKELFDSSDDEADVSRFRHLYDACDNPRSNGSASSADKDSMNERGIGGKNLMNGGQSPRKAPVPHKRSNSKVKKTEDRRKKRRSQLVAKKTVMGKRSKKRRSKLVAKKTIMEQNWSKERKLTLASPQKMKKMKLEGTLVQYLEHCHYGEEGEYLSSSPIPNITFAKRNRKYINFAKVQAPFKAQKYRSSKEIGMVSK
eukprot:scaffold396_cov166-Chaetoceros_neogracile.AAC.2